MRFWSKNMAGVECAFARPVADLPNQHRPLTPQLDLAAILSHVEERVIGNDYTFPLCRPLLTRLRAPSTSWHARQRLRVELRLDGEVKARYQGRYVEVASVACGPAPEPKRANQFARSQCGAE